MAWPAERPPGSRTGDWVRGRGPRDRLRPSASEPSDPPDEAVEQVVAAGIKAVLNFSPGAIKVPAGIKMKSVDLTVSLESLSFYLAQGIDDDA